MERVPFTVGDRVITRPNNEEGLVVDVWELGVKFPYVIKYISDDTHDYFKADELVLAP